MSTKAARLGPILALYLLGIFMGAIDTGIVTPARTVVQNDLAVDEQTGVWMITIYTLAYAAAIPVMGKLADRLGRKPIYLVSIALFGGGSLLCGLSQDFHSFTLLVIARAIQAIGGGGIVPIATAEFGTVVPPEKRGMALGLVGGVYGVANIFGSSAGSLILDAFGHHNWQYIFYVNVPISVVIVLAGLVALPNHRGEEVKRIDLAGIVVLVAMVLALLYGLRNLDFFDIPTSARNADVWPFLAAFLVLLPVFVALERRAQDPVVNLSYFTRRPLVVTLAVSFLTGVVLMGTIFVPQLAENLLGIASGSGGYFVIVLGLAAGVGAPLSGTLTDRFGPRAVLGFGLLASLAGAAMVVWWAIPQPSLASVSACLAVVGLGLGFTIGSPVNYMMLAHTEPKHANSALATLSLVRSVGTTVAPAIMIGFLAHAGVGLQDSLTAQLPTQVSIPALPHVTELQDEFATLKADPELADKLGDVALPDLGRTTIDIDVTGGTGTLPQDLIDELKSSDVTTIVQATKDVATRMFDDRTPTLVTQITDGVNQGLTGLAEAQTQADKAAKDLSDAIAGLDGAIAGMQTAATHSPAVQAQLDATRAQQDGMRAALAKVDGTRTTLVTMQQQLTELKDAVPGAFETAKQNYLAEIDARAPQLRSVFAGTLNEGFKGIYATTAAACVAAGLLLLAYPGGRPRRAADDERGEAVTPDPVSEEGAGEVAPSLQDGGMGPAEGLEQLEQP